MPKEIIIFFKRIKEHLWFKPLLFCIFSVAGALVAHQANDSFLNDLVPDIKIDSIQGLLETISASMLVISTFAVASMVSAFSAASNTATPRSFKIVVTDDVSQYALSIFIGAFIFSIVARVALNNEYYDKAGKFILFILTLLFFVVVILTFIRWVDRISRLGRLEHTVIQVENIAQESLKKYLKSPYLGGTPIHKTYKNTTPITSDEVGYIQHIDLDKLQEIAEKYEIKIQLNCLPGKYVHHHYTLVNLIRSENGSQDEIKAKINDAFHIGNTRQYEDDPRFGFIALTEIASRALSPGINDPGTAIQIIGSHLRLFFLWDEEKTQDDQAIQYDRIEVPKISIQDFFIDAFRPIARDGAGNIEVMLRLQHAFSALNAIDNGKIKEYANQFSLDAFERAKSKINSKADLQMLKNKVLAEQNEQ